MRPIPIVLALAVLGACTEQPLEPAAGQTPAAAAVPLPLCTKTWIDGGGGLWRDALNWLPPSVPTLNDVACLTLPGTYEVTIDSTISVGSIVVGAAAADVTLTFTGELGDRMGIGDEVIVQAGSEFNFVGNGFNVYIGGAITNLGTVRVTESCACSGAGALRLHNSFAKPTHVNHGLLDLSDAVEIDLYPGVTLVNEGTIAVNAAHSPRIVMNSDTSQIGAAIEMRGGAITGTQVLEVDGARPWSNVDLRTFTWSGGSLGTVAGDTSRAILSMSELHVVLSNTALSGRLDLVPASVFDTTRITGDIGPDVHLRIWRDWDHVLAFTGTGGPVTNAGRIDVLKDGFFATDLTLSLPALINTGTITLVDVTHVGLALDSLINTGTIAGNSDLRLATSLSHLRNEGAIVLRQAALHVPLLTTFHAAAGSSMTGTLVLDGGTLEGEGTLDMVRAVDGTIRPGTPIGTLAANALVLGPKSALAIDVAGTEDGEHDLIAVAGEVRYGGTLSITNVAPFAGGMCGQVIPIITDSASAPRGTFSKLVGMVPGPVRQWRLDTSPNVLQLAGFNPVATVFAQPDSVTATEGGASGSYAVCLGQYAPSADGEVTTVRGSTQIEVVPRTLTFTPSNWMLPQFVTAVAINDAIVEGTHADVVNHTIATSDLFYGTAFLRGVDVAIIDNDAASAPAATGRAAVDPVGRGDDARQRERERRAAVRRPSERPR